MRARSSAASAPSVGRRHILDLFVEFRDRTNGLSTPAGAGLVGALTYFGLDTIGSQEKDELRALILRAGPRSEQERTAILDYCATDIVALERLLAAMLPRIDLPRALLRGRYMAAGAAMEHNGVPIDLATLSLLREHWTGIQDDLIRAVDDHGIYDGRTFKIDRWASFLAAQGIPWPLLESGQLDLSDDTFRQAARTYQLVSPYRELRSALSDLRLNDLAVGKDGRNRTILSAFRSRTGRNQPSNSKYIFGPSVWLRGLIQPRPGYGGRISTGRSKNSVRRAPRAIRPCRPNRRRSIWPSPPGVVPEDATKETHGPNESVQVCPASNMGWRRNRSLCASGNRRSWLWTCCGRTGRHIELSGGGQTQPSITPCSTVRCILLSAGTCM
jgi:hypothetical protein